jgi:hypothetical protein
MRSVDRSKTSRPRCNFAANAAHTQLPELFHEIYDTFADSILDDVECLYVAFFSREGAWRDGKGSVTAQFSLGRRYRKP